MRKKLFIALIFLLSVMSCSFIEHSDRGIQNMDNYFDTDEECRTFVNGLYTAAFQISDWRWLVAPRLVNETATDDAWMGNTQQDASGFQPGAQYLITPNRLGYLDDLYRFRDVCITSCNIALEHLSVAPIQEGHRDQYMGEALFLRAYSYFELVNNFGGVPLILKSLSSSDMNMERSSVDQVYDQIEKDLIASSKLLKDAPALLDGMITTWAGKALMARVSLFRGKWKQARDYADSVIRSGVFSLEPNFLDIYNIHNKNGVESILEIQTNSITDKWLGNMLCVFTGARGESKDDFPSGDSGDILGGWGWCTPTSDLENCYLSERDEVRRRSTITVWGDPAYGDEELNPHHKFDLEQNKSGRIIRKFYVPVADRRVLSVPERAPLNVPVLRLAEMYLTRGEARFHLNDIDGALSDIDIVRARVGLTPKVGSVSGNDALRAIWKERRMELAFEGLRLYDIRREIDPDTHQPVICSLMGPEGSFVKYNTQVSTDLFETSNKKELQDKGINFDPSKHLLWPFPQSEIDRSKGLIKQNPNY